VVNDDVGEAKKVHLAEIQELRANEAEARARRDLEFSEVLRLEREEHEEKMRELAEDARAASSTSLRDFHCFTQRETMKTSCSALNIIGHCQDLRFHELTPTFRSFACPLFSMERHTSHNP